MKLQTALWPLLIIPISTLFSAPTEPIVREVLTSQQLFWVKLTPLKTKSKTRKVQAKAELRNAFKIIRYEGDTSRVELDWTMCPAGDCPEAGQFEAGSNVYHKLDSIILSQQKSNAKR